MEINNQNEDKFYKDFYGVRRKMFFRLKDLYKDEYFENETAIKKRKEMYQQEFNRLKNIFDLEKGGKVLDVGCGQGDFLMLFNSKWKKYGMEISEFAKRNAEKRGIITKFDIKDDFFDIIIFRGTIQHIPDPIARIGESYYWLKNNGGIVFLATPNTNSPYYKLFNTLPMLDESRNFLLPSDIMLSQILKNFGFKISEIKYPYLNTPYANPVKDIINFILKLLKIKRKAKPAFFKSMMEIYAQKP